MFVQVRGVSQALRLLRLESPQQSVPVGVSESAFNEADTPNMDGVSILFAISFDGGRVEVLARQDRV